jgi:hypothetical protein
VADAMSELNDLIAPYEYPTDIALRRRWLPSAITVSLVGAVGLVTAGLVTAGIMKAREMNSRVATQNNLSAMGVGLHSCAAITPSQGYIPPSYGEFPPGSGKFGSFFEHLLPYIREGQFYPSPPNAPVKVYIAHMDSRNPGKDSTISYASNATLLGVNEGTPRIPNSFYGRTSGVVVAMERSGMDGAHRWSDDTNYLGGRNIAIPPPQFDVAPANYADGSPQAFTSAGCMVLMGDGSARFVNKSNLPGWS